MSFFLALMVIGFAGLVVMAIPGLARHGHVGGTHTVGHGVSHTISHGMAGNHAAGQPITSGTHAAGGQEAPSSAGAGTAWMGGLIPSPRTLFSLLALYGAFGQAMLRAGHLPLFWASLLAVIPAYLIERFAVTPLWNTLMQFQAEPCAPLEALTLCEAEAVTPFANGRGIVSVVREGRAVQFSARLTEEQAAMPVRVGDKLSIDEVDAARERLTVRLR